MIANSNVSGRRALLRIAAASFASFAGTVDAQPAIFPESILAPDQADVLQLGVGANLEYHSNLFALPSNVRSDTVLTVPLSVRFDRAFARQRLQLDAGATPTKYLDNSQLDYVGYTAGGLWDVELGRPVYAQTELRLTRFRTPFSSTFTDNIEDRALLRALAGFRFTPSWSVFGAIDQNTLDNSAALQLQNDYTFRGYEVGVRYEPAAATDLDFFYRRTDGTYPNRQVVDSTGNLLPGAIDNNFNQDAFLARLIYRPSDQARVVGTAGYTKRDYGTLPQRNFSGLTFGVLAEWAWSGAVTMRVNLLRDIQPDTSVNASFVEVQRIALEPILRVSGRTSITPVASWERRLYEGDPGFVFSGLAARRDTLTRLGAEARYEFARNVYLNAYFWNLRRGSNYALFEFTDNVVGFGVRALF
jgi:hypothetical protein